MASAAELELGDARVEFMADYVLKTLRIKGDKWMKMYSLEENKMMFMDFFEKADNMVFIIQSAGGGALSVAYDWPTTLRNKAVYFVRKGKELISKDANLRNVLYYGDLSYAPLEQLSAFVDEVSCSILIMHMHHNFDLKLKFLLSYLDFGSTTDQ